MRVLTGIMLLGMRAMLLVIFLYIAAAQTIPAGPSVVLVALIKPEYPPIARAANISGEVHIRVTVRPDGTVESAVVEDGHAMLRKSALDSAARSRFECRGCDQTTTTHEIVYIFKIVPGDDCCDAFGVPPDVQQIESATSTATRTLVTVAAKQSCLCNPQAELVQKVRSPKCLWLWKCGSR